jgi:hypothetical protein
MKRTITLIVMISILSFLFGTESFAQQGMKWQGSGNWGPGTQYGRLYNPQTMESISGEVASVDTITPIKGMSSGVHLVVKTDKETISVHLGPAWYIQRQDMKIVPGDKGEITGSRITFQGVIDHPKGATHDRVKGATWKGPFWVSDRASV